MYHHDNISMNAGCSDRWQYQYIGVSIHHHGIMHQVHSHQSISTNALIHSGDEYAYITKRVDRVSAPDQPVRLLAMEDFCQLTYSLTNDKYQSSYERCAKVIERWSSRKGLDMTELENGSVERNM